MEPEQSKGKDKESKNNSNKKETPDEFLSRKEKELGKIISPRFREYFKRELKAISNPSLEAVWEAVSGNA
ncbi:hypothetical protein FH593_21025 (plasmid) [Leptospira interrogans]|uniref:Uncharacterized protein n=3 Tax=Leptospira interrogans TaxID=173 RepID=A0A0E2DBX4_LEPIR|nr:MULTISPECIES: hypothetical protein [Leptospira]EMN30611.1 hypothetical protein LEP1GSC083_0092 [Leptospira interrogans serovar Pyrogenes str. L0374]EKR56974.1 hypothetical protein LEP1GSC105_0083 [Leptospira interrogans str. UI 12758]EMJ35417.1 hypothetical protein LEP1GSC079_5227 [Leptospira interrogans str. FPW1039]EMN35984.1 hypothetical protein LEP1GSC084_1635 [Leptospira interrogans serovar Medanensis str. L0448]EMN95914.1 hypothetical protein LEP1GSC110_0783 [Leptospira interrogans se